MMGRINKLGISVLSILLMLFYNSCSKKSNPADDKAANGFDKTAMLTNYADNLIIPAYEQTQQKLTGLQTAVNVFFATPNATTQVALKAVFKDTYLQVERISVLEFGPSRDNSFIGFINTLPANTMKKVGEKTDLAIMEENIANGSWNLAQNSAIHQQGFPALDYLFFSNGAIAKFADANSTNRKKYVQDILNRIKSLLDQTLSTWKNTYRGQFISNTQSNSGSPISYMLNQFAYEMDMLKGPRIGWPFGTQSGGVQFPELCEAYYSGLSLDLAIENMSSLKKMFTGGSSGKGISDLLAALGNKQLKDEILNQFNVVDAKLKAIPAPLSSALANNKPAIEDANKEIQLLLRLIKTDAVSKLGVQISYVDNDGD
ncbi:imelysin family protein [Pedobacter nyackensis]|uniref:imelysin family protein n=1 Tax=Pedobacter nyackensis TaxID=475255 RepID=UPI00292E03FD|nr:imelysin family protein [Pedobacter nyackensis]